MTNERRTRCGKVVGFWTRPLDEYTYWAEKNWETGEDGFIVVAPSGARLTWHKDEVDALLDADTRNGEAI